MGSPDQMQSIDKLKAAFAASMTLPEDTDYNGIAYGSTAGWDSVAHMALIAHIEEDFDVMLATDDVIDLSSFAKAKEILSKHGLEFK